MALATPQQNLLINAGKVCKAILELQSQIEQVDILYNGSPNWDELITDEEIAGVPFLAEHGLTAQAVADAIYQINQIRAQVVGGNLPAMVLLAQLG